MNLLTEPKYSITKKETTVFLFWEKKKKNTLQN